LNNYLLLVSAPERGLVSEKRITVSERHMSRYLEKYS
jgi:hypothetical protein